MSSSSSPPVKVRVEDVGDDEEDYDQFDDVLDQFNAPQRSQKPVQSPPSSIPPPPPSTSTTSPNNATAEEDAHGEAEATDELTLAFQNELMKGMEDLFKGLSAEDILSTNANNADIDGSKTQVGGGEGGGENDIKEREQAMKAIWEALLAGGEGEGVVEGAGGEGKGKEGAKVDERADKEKEKDFQETVRKTMGKLKGSESTLKDQTTPTLESLLTSAAASGAGGPNEDDLATIIESMMGQLMSKDVLYEPLKELHEKFPEFLATNREKLPKEDLARYEKQLDCVTKIVSIFESPSYDDEDKEWNAKIVGFMTEMQSHGSPPMELMGDIPPGMALGPDGMPNLGMGEGMEGCCVA